LAALIGAVFGAMVFTEINRHAPDDWSWSAGGAARLMQANTLQADYQLICGNNPGTAAVLSEDLRLANTQADVLHNCEAVAARPGKAERGILDAQPTMPLSTRQPSRRQATYVAQWSRQGMGASNSTEIW